MYKKRDRTAVESTYLRLPVLDCAKKMLLDSFRICYRDAGPVARRAFILCENALPHNCGLGKSRDVAAPDNEWSPRGILGSLQLFFGRFSGFSRPNTSGFADWPHVAETVPPIKQHLFRPYAVIVVALFTIPYRSHILQVARS